MGIGDQLNLFWSGSALGMVANAVIGVKSLILGTDEDMTPIQKKVINRMWEGLSKGIGGWEEEYVVGASRAFVDLGIPADDAYRLADGLRKAIPDVPVLRPIIFVVMFLVLVLLIPVKGFQAGFDLIDKRFRALFKPGVGTWPDLITAVWRGADPIKLATLVDETGLSDDWREVVKGVQQYWPDLSQVQELYRRELINESGYDWFLKSLGITDHRLVKNMPDLVWQNPDLATVQELYRRVGLDRSKADPWLRRAGFEGKGADIMLQTAERLIELPNLMELRRRGLLDDRDYRQHMERYGYSEADTKRVSVLYEQIPDGFQLTQAYFRGLLGKRDYLTGLGKIGYSDKDADLIERISWQLPGPADLMRFGVREVFTPEIARRFGQFEQYPRDMTPWANKIGMSEEVAKMYWAAHWDLPAMGQMFDMFHRRIINYQDLERGLRALDVMPFWRKKVIDLSYRLIPRRTLPRLVRQGILGYSAIADRFKRLGYNPEDSTLMARSAVDQAAEPEKEITKTDIINGIRYGWITVPQAKEALSGLEYSDAAVDYYVQEGQRRQALQDSKAVAQTEVSEAAKALELTATEIVRGYLEGIIERTVADRDLVDLGYSTEAVTFKLMLADLQRSRQHKANVAKQWKRLYDRGLRPRVTVEQALFQAGYTAIEASRLLAIWELERTVENELAAVRDRKPTMTDWESWLKLGVVGVNDWVEGMASQGYDDDNIERYLHEFVLKTQKA